jgi:hypothetical protein
MDEESDGKITKRENKVNRNEKEVVSRKCGKRKSHCKEEQEKNDRKEANGAVSLCG